MNLKQETLTRYSGLSIGLHWLMLFLIAAVYATMQFKGMFPRGSEGRQMMATWHFMLGLSVGGLAVLRLIVNLTRMAPAIVPEPPRMQMILAKLMHLALYALMIGLPLAGWLILSAAGKPIPFFGLELPPLLGRNPDLAKQIKGVHEAAASLGMALIAAHAAAALYHHYRMRDNTLVRMMPGKG